MNKQTKLLLLLWTIACAPAQAAPWTVEQKYLEAGYFAVMYLDYKQTLIIAEGNDEVNPMLGSNPSDEKVAKYFMQAGLAHLALAHVLPSKWRTRFQYLTFGGEFAFVLHNHWIGYRIEF